MIAVLPFLALAAAGSGPKADVRDAMVAALSIGRSGLAEARRDHPGIQVRTQSVDGAFSKADLALLREGLGLHAKEPDMSVGVLDIQFHPVTRLPNGRLAERVTFFFGPPSGFIADYVVNPDKGPFGTVERRTIFVQL